MFNISHHWRNLSDLSGILFLPANAEHTLAPLKPQNSSCSHFQQIGFVTKILGLA